MPSTITTQESGETLGYAKADTAENLYENLASYREPYLHRGREAAKLTLPSLLPERGATGSSVYQSPESSFGAAAVNNLAAKIATVLLPPDSPFFVIEPERPVGLVDDAGWGQALAEIKESLAGIEKKVMTTIETRMLRADTIEGMKHMIVAGNVCFKVPPGKRDRLLMYPLSSYVCQRDPRGHLVHLVTCETAFNKSLPEEIKVSCGVLDNDATSNIYTRVSLKDRETEDSPYAYEEWREINGYEIPGSRKSHPDETKLPYLILRFETIPGESYGRGLVEQYQGDILYLNGIAGAIKDAAVVASQVRWMVDPNGNTNLKDLQESANGEFVVGRKADIEALTLDKNVDMQFADQSMRVVEQRLSQAFLLTSSIRRDAERVTAYEIGVMQRDLETTLGGAYSTLSQEYQTPLLENLFESLKSTGDIPKQIKLGTEDNLTVKIISGVTGLGRGTDLQRYDTFLSEIAKFAPEAFAKSLRFEALASRIATSLGIETSELIKTREEVQAEEQQAMAQAAAGQMLQSAMDPRMVQAMQQQQSQQPTQGA